MLGKAYTMIYILAGIGILPGFVETVGLRLRAEMPTAGGLGEQRGAT